MNRNDFLNMIGDPGPFNRQMIGEVYELIDIFPYFQSAHLLLLKGLYNNSDVKFENQLKNSAIHIGDREVLYWLLKNKIPPESSQAKHKITGKTEQVITDKTELTENTEPAITEKTEPVITEKTEPVTEVTGIDSDTQQTVIESAKNSELMINDIEKELVESKKEDKSSPERKFAGHTILIATEPDSIEPAEVIFFNDEINNQDEEKIFFMDPGFSIPEETELLELDLDEDKTLDIIDEKDYNQTPDTSNTNKQLQSELIDKFIFANPRIESQKDRAYVSTEDKAKPFVEESEGLVTETLAKIYVCQGYYSRAIDIYEKLSLKFPEKNSYFASQIEKVKEYIKK